MNTCENCNNWLISSNNKIHNEPDGISSSFKSDNAGSCKLINITDNINAIESDTKSAIIKRLDREQLNIPDSIKFVSGKDFCCNMHSEKSNLDTHVAGSAEPY